MYTIKDIKTDFYDIGLIDVYAVELTLADDAGETYYVLADRFANETHCTVSKQAMIEKYNDREAYDKAVHVDAMERYNFGKGLNVDALVHTKFHAAITVAGLALEDYCIVADREDKVYDVITKYINQKLSDQPCIL